jgi:hypothetical protein
LSIDIHPFPEGFQCTQSALATPKQSCHPGRVIPALRHAQDRLTFGQAGIQMIWEALIDPSCRRRPVSSALIEKGSGLSRNDKTELIRVSLKIPRASGTSWLSASRCIFLAGYRPSPV